MLIVYSDGDEVLVTTPNGESKLLREWFKAGDRDVEEYTRTIYKNVVAISNTGISVDFDGIVTE